MARDYQTKSNVGALPDTITATRFGANEFNSIAVELENAVSTSDQTLAPADGTGEVTDQLAMALAIYGAGGAFYHADSGAVNAYVLTPISPKESPPAYFDGFTVIFEAGTVNTSASTVNVNTLGVKDITYSDGNALVGGELAGSCGIKYNLSDDRFELLFSSGALAGLSQVYVIDASQADQGAASANPNTYTVFDAAAAIGTSKNATLYFPHNPVAGNQTLFTFDTSLDLSSYPYLVFKIDQGAEINRTTGDELLTLFSPSNIKSDAAQYFATDDMLRFANPGKVFPDWWTANEVPGTTDMTNAIQFAINSVTTPENSTIIFGSSTYFTTGDYDLSGLDGLTIKGDGPGATILQLDHATNNLFYTSDTVTIGLDIRDFKVTSTVSRTSGWVFQSASAVGTSGALTRSWFANIEYTKQQNGISLEQYEIVWFNKIFGWDFAGTGGRGFNFGQTVTTGNYNQGSEIYIDDCAIYGDDLSSGVPLLDYGIVCANCDAIYATNLIIGACLISCGYVYGDSGGHAPVNYFLDNCVFDATKTSHSFHAVNLGHTQFSNCWFASAGQITGGSSGLSSLYFDSCIDFTISGGRAYNSTGNAFTLITPSGGNINGMYIVTGGSNYNGVTLTMASTSSIGPVIVGCSMYGNGTGSGILTDANSQRIALVANMINPAESLGVTPSAYGNNLN